MQIFEYIDANAEYIILTKNERRHGKLSNNKAKTSQLSQSQLGIWYRFRLQGRPFIFSSLQLRLYLTLEIESFPTWKKSRLKFLNYNSPRTTIGFLPFLAIKELQGDPAKNGRINIVTRSKEEHKICIENDNYAVATKLLVQLGDQTFRFIQWFYLNNTSWSRSQYQLLIKQSQVLSDESSLDRIDAFRRPLKQGWYRNSVWYNIKNSKIIACKLQVVTHKLWVIINVFYTK